MVSGKLTLDQLLRQYVTLVYAQTGSYAAAASQLLVDYRTVRRQIDRDLLRRYRDR